MHQPPLAFQTAHAADNHPKINAVPPNGATAPHIPVFVNASVIRLPLNRSTPASKKYTLNFNEGKLSNSIPMMITAMA